MSTRSTSIVNSTVARRRGGMYVLVLITVSIVTFMALSALALRGGEHRAAVMMHDTLRARLLAESAVELAQQIIETDPQWRTRAASGVWASDVALDGGMYSIAVRDAGDDRLDDDDSQPIIIRGIGVAGMARQIVEVKMTPRTSPLSCLSVALASRSDVAFNGVTVNNNQKLSSNGAMSADNATVLGLVEARSFSIRGVVIWLTTLLLQDREYPRSDVLDWYVANGTEIPYTALTREATKRVMQNTLLSPWHNDYGPTNPRGIYYINCAGPMVLRNSRIYGTLVLLDVPATGSSIEGSLVMDPAEPGLPALLVRGPVPFRLSNTPLSESVVGRNLNPPGAPFEGVSNSTTTDSFPSRIRGITYVRGDASIVAGNTTFVGSLVVDGQTTISAPASFSFEPTTLAPPGFGSTSGHRMRIVARSFVRVTD